MKDLKGYNDMILMNNSEIHIFSGTLQNCSAQNFSLFTIYNSNFYFENTQIYNFHSMLIYSDLGFIGVDQCSLNNINSSNFENSFIIQLVNNVSSIIKNSIFQNLNNFMRVKKKFETI